MVHLVHHVQHINWDLAPLDKVTDLVLSLSGFDMLDVFCCNVYRSVAICYSCHWDLTILVRVRQWADQHCAWA